jgi:hypothetical protein
MKSDEWRALGFDPLEELVFTVSTTSEVERVRDKPKGRCT